MNDGENGHDDKKQQPGNDPDGMHPRMSFIKSKRSKKQDPEHNAGNPSSVPFWPSHAAASVISASPLLPLGVGFQSHSPAIAAGLFCHTISLQHSGDAKSLVWFQRVA
jgi:hypothetical protein